ncbi:E3 ubiquitin-protein ligase TRIM21 isoform X2 [Phycodurus eques]|uniref:E3 ubiquitin-protein ligase TRIM21 isoform X2 n=1 Tax=Phycodurus eques TaxID=693459 RepID=UPI002ACDFADA|nr:E3 ubiquitin-protein ligase TRIM21 isoform X2 [Phycodurus eques]
MAVAMPRDFLSEDQISCSICLEVFGNPVTTPCGHSFCQACISSYWDRRANTKVYLCPLCKESFHKRPELHVNRALKEITQQFKKITNTGVAADVGGKRGMEDTALSSFHSKLFPQSTSLAHPSMQMQSNEHSDPPPPSSHPSRNTWNHPSDSSPCSPMCPIHQRLKELFCRTDASCVCSVCAESFAHKGHDIIPVKTEWDIKKSQLGTAEEHLKELICKREKKCQEINNSLLGIDAAAEREVEGTVSVFSKLISTMECCQAHVLEVIEMNRRTAHHRSQSLLTVLEEEIAELKNRSTSLGHLALTEDHILFLQMFPSLSTPPQLNDSSNVSMSSEMTTGTILESVSQMTERFQEEIQKLPMECNKSLLLRSVDRPKPRAKMVQDYAANITLDPNTAHPHLIISVDGKQVFCGGSQRPVPDSPNRFDRVVCVLAHQGFRSGRHYWEVEVGEKTDWDLGVASRSIRRKGKITVNPAHGFWFLSLRDQVDYTFRTEPSTIIQVKPRPSRVGVFVDCDKGVVSFYNVEAKVLIYRFRDEFHDTVHPFFSPCTNKSGKNDAPLIICPFAMTNCN